MSNKRGFTLIELLVVISIIGILATIVLVSLGSARIKARSARRITDLNQIRIALEMYYSENGLYPVVGGWQSECNCWGGYTAENIVPGLTPYMKVFPTEPSMDKSACTACYLYYSNGTDYKVLDHNITEFSSADYLKQSTLIDPARDSGPNGCVVDGSGIWSWAIYSPGGACW
ncbi:MAG: type II secretion system protein [Candidatus Portnoybacteria bacterium]|nr:type II secretion system protein [Candidatus Portnoybacteria bacterium]